MKNTSKIFSRNKVKVTFLTTIFFTVFFIFNLSITINAGYKSGRHKYKDGELIIKFKKGVSASKVADSHKVIGAKGWKRLHLINAEHVILPEGLTVEEALERYRSDPNVEYAEPNYRVHKVSLTPDDSYFSSQWGLKKIEAEKAWDISRGSSSVLVAVLDTGIDYNHPDLKDNIWLNPDEKCSDGNDNDNNEKIDDCKGWDFVNDDNDPMDDDRSGSGSHGTHVAGIIGAIGNNGYGVAGVSWQVKLMPLKVLDNKGSGYISDIIDAINYAKNKGAKIINLSLEAEEAESGINSLKDAMSSANDCLFIVAAGNKGYDLDKINIYPASFKLENLISVGATDNSDSKGYFSNYGINTVHLAAPGSKIYSTQSRMAPGFVNYTTAFFYETGTSMAAPFVTGVAALLKANNQNLTNKDIKEIILASVDKINNLPFFTGGRLNAYKALTINLDELPPLKPENLSFAEQPSAGNPIKLKWTDISSKETNYIFERNLRNNGFSLLSILPANQNTYTDNISLQEGDIVSYRVYAENSKGKSDYVELSFSIPLYQPENLVATKIGGGIKLSWDDKTDKEDGYEIWRQSGTNDYQMIATVDKDVTVYNDTNLSSNETFYYYKVRAYNSQKVYSYYSNEAFVRFQIQSSSGSKSCFIATAAYGTPYHPDIDVLRNFRDKYLLNFDLGRAFVKLYYKFSPPVAHVISKSLLLRAIVLSLLLPIVYLIKFPVTYFLILFMLLFLLKKRRIIKFCK